MGNWEIEPPTKAQIELLDKLAHRMGRRRAWVDTRKEASVLIDYLLDVIDNGYPASMSLKRRERFTLAREQVRAAKATTS